MKRHWTDQMSDYLDGGLTPGDAAELEAHLSDCRECSATLAQLREVREHARSLEAPAPPFDLWPGILARIGEREPRAAGAAAVTDIRSHRRWLDRRLSFSLPQAVAASAAIALLSAAAAWWILQRAPLGSRGESPVAQAPVRTPDGVASEPGAPAAHDAGGGVAAETQVQASDSRPRPERQETPAGRHGPEAAVAVSAGPSYDATIAELQRLLASERSRLDTTTVRILEQNLAIVDRAVEDARRAIAADPGNPYLRSHLASTMRRKVDLLRRATVIAGAQG